MKHLKSFCSYFANRCAKAVFSSESFKNFPTELIIHLFNLESLKILNQKQLEVNFIFVDC
jgi:hypothetical protein